VVANLVRFQIIISWPSVLVGNVFGRINEVNRRLAQLVLGFVTISVCNQPSRPTQPGHPSVGRRNEYQQKLGRKQAHPAMY